jgi:hypothetical protein
LAGLPIRHNLDRDDVSSFGEQDFEFRFAGLEREVGHINLLIHIVAPQISLFAETVGTQ